MYFKKKENKAYTPFELKVLYPLRRLHFSLTTEVSVDYVSYRHITRRSVLYDVTRVRATRGGLWDKLTIKGNLDTSTF